MTLEESLPGRTRALIERRLQPKFRSLAQLERAIGMENIGRRLSRAETNKYIPMDLIVAVHEATGITIGEMCVAMFDDAGFGEYLPYLDLDPAAIHTAMEILSAPQAERDMIVAVLGWMRSLRPQPPD